MEKHFNSLVVNGNIVGKLLSSIVCQLNAKKKLKLYRIHEDISRDVYVSAYNFCIIGYQDELERYFSD